MSDFKTDVEKAATDAGLGWLQHESHKANSIIGIYKDAFLAGAKFGREREKKDFELIKEEWRMQVIEAKERGFQEAIDQVAEMFADESCIDHEVEGGFCIATRVRELGKALAVDATEDA